MVLQKGKHGSYLLLAIAPFLSVKLAENWSQNFLVTKFTGDPGIQILAKNEILCFNKMFLSL